MRCQHVDAATAVYTIFVGFVPGSLGDIHDTGKNAWRDAAGQDQCSACVIDFDFITVLDAACLCIDWIDKDTLRKSFFQPIVVVMRGVNTVKSVVPNRLKREFIV